MMAYRSLLLTLSSVTLGGSLAFGAFVTQFTGPEGGNWNVPGNWSAGVPTSTDEISLGGFSVVVTDSQTYNDFDTAGPAQGGAITILNGGTLTTTGDFHAAFGLTGGITVESGGTFIATGPTANTQLRSVTTLEAGGLIQGFNSIRTVFNINGEWQPLGSAGSLVPNSITVDGTVNLNNGGVIEMTLFGNNDNEFFDVLNADTLNLNIAGSTLRLVPDGGYTPTAGDSFDLWNVNGTGTANVIGDASNVIIEGQTVQWDTSQWVSDGILTIVPEPSSYSLLAGVMALAVLVQRRRSRA